MDEYGFTIENLNDSNKFDLWVDKYKPKKLSDIIGNKQNIEKIKKWFFDFKNNVPNTKPALFITGPPGIGKTTIANCILQEKGYDVIEFNSSDVRAQKIIKEKLTKILNTNNIGQLINDDNNIKGIIMDEIDGMSGGDRGGLNELIDLLSPEKKKGRKKKNMINKLPYKNPIICISNKSVEKKINELKKITCNIYFEKPTFKELSNFIIKIANNENIDINTDIINNVIKNGQFDIRRILGILQEINRNKNIEIENALSLYDMKDIDFTLQDSLKNIFTGYNNLNESLKFYEIDKNAIPLMIHENYINYMNKTVTDSHKKDELHHNILDSLSLGDYIDKFMYSDQYWDLYLENGVNKCVYPSYNINKFSLFKFYNIEFNYSTLLSKSSQQFSCYKDLIEIVNKSEYNLETTIYLIENIIYNLFNKKGDKEIGIKLLINNNLSIDNIDKLLKVCKIHKSYKLDYTCKYKTILTKLYKSLIE